MINALLKTLQNRKCIEYKARVIDPIILSEIGRLVKLSSDEIIAGNMYRISVQLEY